MIRLPNPNSVTFYSQRIMTWGVVLILLAFLGIPFLNGLMDKFMDRSIESERKQDKEQAEMLAERGLASMRIGKSKSDVEQENTDRIKRFLDKPVKPILLVFGGIFLAGGFISFMVGMMQKSPPEPNIQEKVEQLGQLKDQGLISEEEFEQKKKELLSEL